MKFYYLFFTILLFTGCKTQRNSTEIQTQGITQMESKSECPEGGKCTVVVQKNKSLQIKEDGIGALYPEITEGDNIVVQYTFLRQAPEGIADGNYSESVYFEIPQNSKKVTKENASLSDVKLLFGRHFFSPQSGYFRINQGKLIVDNSGNKIDFDLSFEIKEGNQLLTHIKESVEIK